MSVATGPTAEIVTAVAEREPVYSHLGITAPMRAWFDESTRRAWLEAGGQEEYRYRSGTEMDATLVKVGALVGQGSVQEAVTLAYESTLPSRGTFREVDMWTYMTLQLPADWGPVYLEDRQDIRKRLTANASGVVLEAMCGFTSYVDDAPHISEVVAMDFCREGLERYDHPERTRILFDLETVEAPGSIDFLEDDVLDSICITFGVDYLSNVDAVYAEFRRLLKPGGNILIVGGHGCGYPDLLRQRFNPSYHAGRLQVAGFETFVTDLPYDKKLLNNNGFALIEATKAD